MPSTPKHKSESDIVYNFANEYFPKSKYEPLINHNYIDLAIYPKNSDLPLLFAEAKQRPTDINVMFTQLIFTIYKIYKTEFSPQFLCVFDSEKVAFIPFSAVEHLYNEYQTADFDWTVTPSNHNTKEFKIIAGLIKSAINNNEETTQNNNFAKSKFAENSPLLFYFAKDKNEIKEWVKLNINPDAPAGPLEINNENFNKVYYRWREVVMPTIDEDWEAVRQQLGILDCDYFLADLFAKDNRTMHEKLYVLLKSDYYKMVKDPLHSQKSLFNARDIYFTDKQVAHNQFWQKYRRPPEDEYWDMILKRRDLLVPLDVRQRLGAFFTPPEWVALSQKYMAEVFGDLSEYYIWDCAAGTGNLLQGLEQNGKNYNLFASDINIENVYVMHGRIDEGTLNIPESHAFQFDFLNDDFDKLPKDLLDIINDPEKRKKLIVYINPPYAEAADKKTLIGIGKNKKDVAVKSKVYTDYFEYIRIAGRELYAQFLMRIYQELQRCKIANFAKLKALSASNFATFRQYFLAEFKGGFLVPADTFDNVSGQFPIGFHIWDTEIEKKITNCEFDVYDKEKNSIGKKKVFCYDGKKSINDWIITTRNQSNENKIGFMVCKGSDFQTINLVFITNDKTQHPHPRGTWITDKNLIHACIYFSVRKVIPADWLNDRDQFLYPNALLESDKLFHSDCLAYSLFHGSNNIQSGFGVNHWIPFSEEEVSPKELFKSHFMTDFIAGKLPSPTDIVPIFSSFPRRRESPIPCDEAQEASKGRNAPSPKEQPAANPPFADLLHRESTNDKPKPLEFSEQAKELFTCGRNLWRYYHREARNDENYLNDASFYDIRKYFQGTNDKGHSRGPSIPFNTGYVVSQSANPPSANLLPSAKTRMNNKSSDAEYNKLLTNLRKALKKLGDERIAEKVFEYGFLLR